MRRFLATLMASLLLATAAYATQYKNITITFRQTLGNGQIKYEGKDAQGNKFEAYTDDADHKEAMDDEWDNPGDYITTIDIDPNNDIEAVGQGKAPENAGDVGSASK